MNAMPAKSKPKLGTSSQDLQDFSYRKLDIL
jgi:hypothetical protein